MCRQHVKMKFSGKFIIGTNAATSDLKTDSSVPMQDKPSTVNRANEVDANDTVADRCSDQTRMKMTIIIISLATVPGIANERH